MANHRDEIHERDAKILARLAQEEADLAAWEEQQAISTSTPQKTNGRERGGEAVKAAAKAKEHALADPATLRLDATGWIDREPPPTEWLFADALPLGECGCIAAPGASSKTWMLLQMAISVACGVGVAGTGMAGPCYEPVKTRPVVLLTAEEKPENLHYRVWQIVDSMRAAGQFTAHAEELLRENLHLMSVRGMNTLTKIRQPGSLEHVETPFAWRVELMLEQIPGIGLIIVDPVSRFRPGDENDVAATTAFVVWLEKLSERFKCSVLITSHVNKWSKQEEEITVDSLRGSTSLPDSLRWVTIMRVATKTERERYSIPESDKDKYIQVRLVKANNVRSQDPFWLERCSGGVLRMVRMGRGRDPEPQQQSYRASEAEYARVSAAVLEFVTAHPGEYSRRRLCADHGQASGLFGASDKKLRAVVHRMIEERILALDGGDQGGCLIPGGG